MALGDIHLRFTWQAWYLRDWAGSGFTWQAWYLYGTGLALVARLICDAAPSFHVAGAALGDTYLRFTWQAWRLATSTVVSRGRRGTYGAGLALVTRLDLP